MLSVILRYYHTLKFLQWTQIKYRLLYQINLPRIKTKHLGNTTSPDFQLIRSIPSNDSWHGKDTFEFLNIQHVFKNGIDWNCKVHGKLWTYNLNYFEFLSQPNLSKHEGIGLIHDFISHQENIKDGMEPFPISLRCLFWIKFLIRHQINDPQINQSLFHQLQLLSQRLEYHLLGNHLLENGFSLLFGAVYFNDDFLLKQAKSILNEQLEEQILEDGSHFELSPMYHQIMLFRLLDCINLMEHNEEDQTKDLLEKMKEKSALMLGWLEQMTFANGDLPNVNDSIPGIAPTSKSLIEYSRRLSIKPNKQLLTECGYRKIKLVGFELIIDVGSIGPDYIPGHAHSDTFSFILHLKHRPFIVDTGITTYEKNDRRNQERSTSSHNTVMIDGMEQSEVWGGFRVGRRAKITHLEESTNRITAIHDGFHTINCQHERTFIYEDQKIEIIDKVLGGKQATAFFHFHSDQSIFLKGHEINGSFGTIEFDHADHVFLEPYLLATGFNKTVKATRAVVFFRAKLHTKITVE